MRKIKSLISICFFFIIYSFCFGQDYETFNINKVKFTVDSLNDNSINWLDSVISVNPNAPIISAINGNPPFNPYLNPWSPSSIHYWYFYLPYSDTLTISIFNKNEKENSEPKNIVLKKGRYVLKSDSQNVDTIDGSSIYTLSIRFCGSISKRNIMIIK